MSSLKSLGFVLAFALPLFAQEEPLTVHQVGAYKGHEDAVRLVMDYCDATDDSSEQYQPQIFAESEPTTRGDARQWEQFANRDQWEAAGRPTPLVFVWDRNGTTVRVTVVAHPPQVWKPIGAYRRTDYCYGADARLSRVRAVWYFPTRCEFLFPCQLIRGRGFYLGQSPAITDWVFTPDGKIRKLRDGEAQDDYFDPSYSLTVRDLHLKTSDDLPFKHPAQSK
jgi:hypothetical protein